MQAIWMQNLAAMLLGHAPTLFEYRGTAPLTCGQPVRVEANTGPDGIALRVHRTSDNTVTMQGTATA
jgi:3-methylfumaryl-CoA hydratase